MAAEKKQRKKFIEPMRFYDKSKLVDPMEEVNKETAYPSQSRKSFIEDMRRQVHTPDQSPEKQAPAAPEENTVPASGNPVQKVVPQTQTNLPVRIADPGAETAAKLEKALAEDSVCRKDGPTPLDLVKKMKARYAMCVIDNELYLYMQNHYRKMNQSDMETEIWRACRDEVEKTGSKNILTGAFNLLKVDPDLKAPKLRSAANLVPFRNGLLRLDDGVLMNHSPEYFNTFVLQCDCIPTENCPLFDRYLQDVTGGDQTLIERIWEFIGYCMTQVDGKVLFVVQGRPHGGKSVIVNLMRCLFPSHVQSALDVHALNGEFSLKEYKDKVFCVSSDMLDGALDRTVVSTLKKLTGRDRVNADVKYGDRVEFRFTGRVVLVSNHPILLKNPDPAFWARVVAIPFLYEVPEEKQDLELEDKLVAELPAIAYRGMTAFFSLRRKNYRFAGDYSVNCGELYSECTSAADPATLVFLFLQKHFEKGGEEDLLVVEEAAEMFNRVYGVRMSTNQFSNVFCQQAAQMYGTEKVRSRAGNYENARSCLKGLRYIKN